MPVDAPGAPEDAPEDQDGSHLPEPVPSPTSREWWTVRRVAAVVLAVVIFGFWTWLIFLAPEQEPRDRLDDPAFAEEAEGVCAAAQAEVADIAPAYTAEVPEDRAVLVDEGTVALRAMVADLRTFAPEDGRDGDMVQEWLDDWGTYLGDRDAWSAQLAAGEDVQFTLTPKGGDQITEALDGFAEANDMDACSTPLDV